MQNLYIHMFVHEYVYVHVYAYMCIDKGSSYFGDATSCADTELH